MMKGIGMVATGEIIGIAAAIDEEGVASAMMIEIGNPDDKQLTRQKVWSV